MRSQIPSIAPAARTAARRQCRLQEHAMSGTGFAQRSRRRLALWSACLLAQAVLLAPLCADPAQSSLSPKQQQKLKERDRYTEEASRLRQQGKVSEAIAAARKMLAIERQVFGDVHEDVAGSLEWLADMYEQREDFAAAVAARREVLAVRTKLHGEKHWKTTDARLALADAEHQGRMTATQRRRLAEAQRLNDEVVALYGQGRYREAIERARQVLEIRKDELGDRHALYAIGMNNLALLYNSIGNYAKAEPLYRRALQIKKVALGEQHPDYATGLNNLAGLYRATGDYTKAEPLYRQAAEIHKQTLGARHPACATNLNNLALLYQDMGWYARAESLYRQAKDIYKEALGEKHPLYATSLNNLARLYQVTGEYAKAEPLLSQALAIREQALGKQHPDYAISLNNLARLYRAMGEYAKAEPLLRQALQIKKEALGEHHPDYAISLNELALLYRSLGDYARAEPLFQQALQINKQALGERHPDYAISLNNLALLYQDMGDFTRAEPLLRQALRIARQSVGEHHPTYAVGLTSLAHLYVVRRDYDRAEPLYRKALEIRKQALGERHLDYATTLNELAWLYESKGDYSRAEPLYRQALEIRKQALGEQHPDYATALNNLAALYKFMGDYARAEPLYRRALQITSRALGEQHPDCATGLDNQAWLYRAEAARLQFLLPPAAPPHQLAALCACAADCARAHDRLRRSVEISRANLELAAAAQSQRQQLDLLTQMRRRLDAYLSLAPQGPQDAAAQYRAVLAWKGAVGRRQRYERLARRRPDLAADFAALDRASMRLAALALGAPDPRRLQERHRQIQELTDEKERLERALAGKSVTFRTAKGMQHLEPSQLRASLPADAVLLDFLEYDQFDPIPWKKDGWGWEQRLAAFVVRRDGLVRVDLGPVRAVSETVQRWRQALQRRFRTEGDSRLGTEVRQLVWEPLAPHLSGTRLVLVAPDGVLTRVPFAALPGGRKDSYLLEEVALAVVPVPQLLPELVAPRGDDGKAEPSLLVVGDVRYDAADSGAAAADSRSAPRGGALMQWKTLEGTRAEVAAIKDSFQRRFRKGTVTDLREDEATEAEVRKEAPAQRYLHFATHGFFAPKELRSALAEASRGGKADADNLFEHGGVAGFHPGLLSGVVLAGANRPADPARDDGILTALEVEALDLSGVELATLSACETGLGEEAGGEGLLGLQRAFQLAGARGVVASLWTVDDKATRELMVRFYENLWKRRMSKLEALRQAQLWMLREGASRGMVDVRVPTERLPIEDNRLAPYYWAAFCLSGDWR
jgi:CHAT domain-containing protein/Tfp pilus assembly protein PilF